MQQTKAVRTVKTADDGLLLVALFNHNLDVRVRASKGLEPGRQELARRCGGRPLVAVLEDELAYLRDEGDVPIRRLRDELSPTNGRRRCDTSERRGERGLREGHC